MKNVRFNKEIEKRLETIGIKKTELYGQYTNGDLNLYLYINANGQYHYQISCCVIKNYDEATKKTDELLDTIYLCEQIINDSDIEEPKFRVVEVDNETDKRNDA